jgi:nucleotide-binding universal stress UspA family protein
MFTRILVPLDGSRRAEVAVLTAARLARASHGTVILMRAIAPASPASSPAALGYTSTAESTEYTEFTQARDQAQRYLEQVADSAALAGVSTLTRVLVGSAAERILTSASDEQADLVALCARGLSGYHRWKLGGVSQHVVRHATCPIFLLPDPAPDAVPGALTDPLASARRALVPLDGSPLAEKALPAAIALLAALAPERSELHLLQVVEPLAVEDNRTSEQGALQAANAYLRGVADRLCAAPTKPVRLSVTTAAEVDSDSAEHILETAQPELEIDEVGVPFQGYDLIAMATHGRTGVLRWTTGSITERVMQMAKTPMLIVRPSSHKNLSSV